MDNRAYWIWAQQAFGEGSPTPWLIYRRFSGGLREFFDSGPRLWNTCAFIAEREAEALFQFSLGEAQARLEYADKVGWTVLTPECEKYPEALRNIFDPPAVLYLKGSLPDMENVPVISVVGARKAEEDSLRAALRFGYQLAAGGAVVVSGGAVGVDGSAMEGALSVPGRVVSVLPVDLGSPYLNRNAGLRRLIPERGGALVSEYFSQRNPGRGAFHVRNRLITGLSNGVLLIQAAAKSGTMIYAKRAQEQNRDVFVYPGEGSAAESEAFAGSRSLLLDGATPVTCGEEILDEYALRFTHKRNNPFQGIFDKRSEADPLSKQPKKLAFGDSGVQEPADLPDGENALLKALGTETRSIAWLEEALGVPAARLLGELTELELLGLVESLPGKRYRRRGL